MDADEGFTPTAAREPLSCTSARAVHAHLARHHDAVRWTLLGCIACPAESIGKLEDFTALSVCLRTSLVVRMYREHVRCARARGAPARSGHSRDGAVRCAGDSCARLVPCDVRAAGAGSPGVRVRCPAGMHCRAVTWLCHSRTQGVGACGDGDGGPRAPPLAPVPPPRVPPRARARTGAAGRGGAEGGGDACAARPVARRGRVVCDARCTDARGRSLGPPRC